MVLDEFSRLGNISIKGSANRLAPNEYEKGYGVSLSSYDYRNRLDPELLFFSGVLAKQNEFATISSNILNK